jgi:hypothetical protein
MSHCTGISEAAFENLRGFSWLRMQYCYQPAITVAALGHLKGIQELDMYGCGAAVVAAASGRFPQARSVIGRSFRGPISDAIQATNLPECRRLLATRAVGSHCWIYAGIYFQEPVSPATALDVIVSACTELLQVGVEVSSDGILAQALWAMYIVAMPHNDAVIAAVPAVVSALRDFSRDAVIGLSGCLVLSEISKHPAGVAACLAAGAIPLLLRVKTYTQNAASQHYAREALQNLGMH